MKKKYLSIVLFFLWGCEVSPPTNWDGTWIGITVGGSNDILEIITPDGANYKVAQFTEEGARKEEIVTCAMNTISSSEARITCGLIESAILKIKGDLIELRMIEETEEESNAGIHPCINPLVVTQKLGYDSKEQAFQAVADALGYDSIEEAFLPIATGNCNDDIVMMMRLDVS